MPFVVDIGDYGGCFEDETTDQTDALLDRLRQDEALFRTVALEVTTFSFG